MPYIKGVWYAKKETKKKARGRVKRGMQIIRKYKKELQSKKAKGK